VDFDKLVEILASRYNFRLGRAHALLIN